MRIVLYPADNLLENFSCLVLWQLAAADYEVKQLAVRAVSGGKDELKREAKLIMGFRRAEATKHKTEHKFMK